MEGGLMPYQLAVCPTCGNTVQAQIQRSQPGLFVGLHTRKDGTGRMCAGVGQKVETQS
jgi:hypothetical protein